MAHNHDSKAIRTVIVKTKLDIADKGYINTIDPRNYETLFFPSIRLINNTVAPFSDALIQEQLFFVRNTSLPRSSFGI